MAEIGGENAPGTIGIQRTTGEIGSFGISEKVSLDGIIVRRRCAQF